MSDDGGPAEDLAGPPDLVDGATRLRGVRPGDAGALFSCVHDAPEVTRWLCWEGPSDLEEMERRYASWRLGTPGERVLVLAIEEVPGGAILGEVTLRFDGHPGVGDLGYWLGAAHHGKGHGARAVGLALRLAFESYGAHTVTASVKEGNDASLAVLDRAGFVRDRAPGAAPIVRADDP
ncbi:MAG: GNAT family N-acetyltransferase, partial [Planctomycetota bacterium]|nr:GNAT family N-acetyltransferase [Planctomycetota bacterium]